MAWTTFCGRRAYQLENESLHLTVTAEGGHLAQMVHKATGVSPLWSPPWPTMEPSQYKPEMHPEYGDSQEALVLAGILGHSLCLDTYGAPSPEEAAAGMPIHGEALCAAYEVVEQSQTSVRLSTELQLAQIGFEREIELMGDVVYFRGTVTNRSASDRPIAWTQHVTIGPPYLQLGKTEFRMPALRSNVIGMDFGGAQLQGAEFQWPLCPLASGGVQDLSRFPGAERSAGFTTHLVDTRREHGCFTAWSPEDRVSLGYAWRRADFPWVCRWEENCSRQAVPWNGKTVACAFEFGVSPTIESRRDMVKRGSWFGEPAYRWLPARGVLRANYCAVLGRTDAPPESVVWDGNRSVRFH